MLRNFIEPKKGVLRRNCSCRNTLRQSIRCPFSDQLKQMVELHKAAELAMKDLIVRLWPAEPMPSSYFGLVKRLVDACPRLNIIKRSVYIEGARMAFARVKVWWAKMDAVKLVTEGPPEGKEHRTPE